MFVTSFIMQAVYGSAMLSSYKPELFLTLNEINVAPCSAFSCDATRLALYVPWDAHDWSSRGMKFNETE